MEVLWRGCTFARGEGKNSCKYHAVTASFNCSAVWLKKYQSKLSACKGEVYMFYAYRNRESRFCQYEIACQMLAGSISDGFRTSHPYSPVLTHPQTNKNSCGAPV